MMRKADFILLTPPIVGQGTSAVDSTAAQTLAVTADWDEASTAKSITLGQAILEKLS